MRIPADVKLANGANWLDTYSAAVTTLSDTARRLFTLSIVVLVVALLLRHDDDDDDDILAPPPHTHPGVHPLHLL